MGRINHLKGVELDMVEIFVCDHIGKSIFTLVKIESFGKNDLIVEYCPGEESLTTGEITTHTYEMSDFFKFSRKYKINKILE